MKYSKLFTALLAAALLTGCAEEELNSTSIFAGETEAPMNEFDQWIKTNLVDPYNIDMTYLYVDKETNLSYNVVPPQIDKAKAFAMLTKKVWIESYANVMGQDFVKRYAPRLMQLVGSPQYDGQGKLVLGTAEGGIKVTLFNINSMDVDKTYIDVDSPFPNTGAVPIDMNYWFFHTMHHEFCHILTQKKNYDPTFQAVSAGKYRSADWINVKDADAPPQGFVSGYGSGEYNEDFAEIYATYITHTPEAWQKILEAGMVPKMNGADTVYAVDDKGQFIYVTDAKGQKIPLFNQDGTVKVLKDGYGNTIFQKAQDGKTEQLYLVNGKPVPVYKIHGQPVYILQNGELIIAFRYNGKLYPVTDYAGEMVYQTDDLGNIMYDAEGKPVPTYYKLPEIDYKRQIDYDTEGKDAILTKLDILRKYFKDSWGMDIDKMRDEVLKQSMEAEKMDLRTLK